MYPNNYPNPYPRINNGINWVQGIESAKAFQLMPNSNVMLLDSENEGIFYIKTSDNVGMCNLRTFKYEEVQASNKVDTSQFITRDELQSILDERLRDGKQFIQSNKSANIKQSN